LAFGALGAGAQVGAQLPAFAGRLGAHLVQHLLGIGANPSGFFLGGEHGNRERWPWLPGTIVEQCGPDEWYVCIEVRELAVLRDGRRAPRGTASRNLCYPCCFRDSSEIRPRSASSGPASGTRRGATR
jgi:hypothetical protein